MKAYRALQELIEGRIQNAVDNVSARYQYKENGLAYWEGQRDALKDLKVTLALREIA